MSVTAKFVGGPLNGQIKELDQKRLYHWYVTIYQSSSTDFSNFPNLIQLRYELIAGVYYFESDSEEAKIWKGDQEETRK